MKIGVITFFGNGNYGSELQALAMNGFCQERGHQVTFLRIYSSNRFVRYVKRIWDKLCVWYNCKIDTEYLKVYNDLRSNVKKQSDISTELRNYVQSKVRHLIKTGNISAFRMRYRSPFDCYICGSDQVWSALIQPVWTCNFLKGVSANRKIAYAPSIGVNEMPEYFIRTISPLVRGFKFLSVREQSVADLFEQKIGVKPFVAVDPTILVGRSFWEDYLRKENLSKPNMPYIFCYFLGELNDDQVDFLNHFAGDREIIILPYEQYAKRLNKGKYVIADHLEFVNYIRYADYVFTDSFHATVFSLLYHKEFAVFQRSHVGVTKQTSRIESLLSLVHSECRLVENPNKVDSFSAINYDLVDGIIEKQRKESIQFLDKALRQVQNSI